MKGRKYKKIIERNYLKAVKMDTTKIEEEKYFAKE